MEHISTASLTSTLLEVLEDSTFFIPFSWSISVQLLHFLEQVYKRLKLTLELVKKEMEISKLQVIHSSISSLGYHCLVEHLW